MTRRPPGKYCSLRGSSIGGRRTQSPSATSSSFTRLTPTSKRCGSLFSTKSVEPIPASPASQRQSSEAGASGGLLSIEDEDDLRLSPGLNLQINNLGRPGGLKRIDRRCSWLRFREWRRKYVTRVFLEVVVHLHRPAGAGDRTPVASQSCEAPQESILYSLVLGRTELVMFGGLQKDVSLSGGRSQQNNSETVSNCLFFLNPPPTN